MFGFSDYIEYTDSLLPVLSAGRQSTAIRALWYNENTRSLVVVLEDSLNAYEYSGVSPFVWATLKAAQSKGNYYAHEIKPKYGPGKHLGAAEDIGIEKVKVGVPAADMSKVDATVGTPKGLTYSDEAVVDGIKVGDNLHENPAFVTLGVEDDLDPDDEFLNDYDDEDDEEETSYFSLTLVDDIKAPEGVKSLHEVVFVDSENPTKELTRKVEAGSVQEAVSDVEEVAAMLDRTFLVKRVTVHFE